jgi:UDP-N-acetylmuramate dehydrogenase
VIPSDTDNNAAVRESNYISIDDFLSLNQIIYHKNFSLASVSLLLSGGTCRYFIVPDAVDKLLAVLTFLRSSGESFLLVGRLSNVLFRDGHIDTVIISTSKLNGYGFTGDSEYRADCGASLPAIAREISRAGYTGFSGLIGVPASLGGAIYMNASCYGNSISDCLVKVRCVKVCGTIVDIRKDEVGFSWRHSGFHDQLKGMVILEACFHLCRGDTAQIEAHMTASASHRRRFQEQRYPNLGSTFATRDIYSAIAGRFLFYRFGYWLIRLWVKLHSRDKDSLWARLINRYTQRYFGIKETERVGFSDSTFNCVVNKGGASASELISFLRQVEQRIEHCLPLEIEIFEDIA